MIISVLEGAKNSNNAIAGLRWRDAMFDSPEELLKRFGSKKIPTISDLL